MGSTDDCLLKAKLLLYPKKTKAEVKLTTNSVIIETPSGPEVIDLNDVTGCHITSGNNTTCAKWHICIFFYPLKKKIFKGLVRHKMSRSFGFKCEPTEEENLELAKKWKRVIQHLISGSNVNSDNVDNLDDPTPRHLLVYVNPFSGQAKASEMYKNFVKPMFAEADIKHTMVKTEYAGHARKLVKDLDLTKYDGIVIVSGDGLVHEVINGLMDRSDWQTAIKTPLGIVPGGSGNALAAAIVYASTGQHLSEDIVSDCLFEIIRGRRRDLSIVLAQSREERFYSFLNVGWGFVADVDIESEKYRALGHARFTVGCFVRTVNLRKYHGMISYLPLEDSVGEPFPGDNIDSCVTYFEGTSFRKNPSYSDQPAEIPVGKISSDRHGNNQPDDVTARDNFHLHGDVTEVLPPGWRSLEGEFVWVMPVYLSHVGKDMFMMPQAQLDDDVIYLYCLKAGVGKIGLLSILLSIAEGKHLNQYPDDTLVIPCRAFRLEPFTNITGLLTIDGEAISHEPIQATVTPVKARVMCSKCSS